MLTTYALSGIALASMVLANHCPDNTCTDALRFYGKAAEFCAKYENHKKAQPAKVTGSCEKEDTCVCPPSSTFPYPEVLQPCFDDSTMADIEASCRECWFPNTTTLENSSAPTSPAQSGLASSPSNTQGASAPGESSGPGAQGSSPSNNQGSKGPSESGSSPSNNQGSKGPGESGSPGQNAGSPSQGSNSPSVTGGASGPGESGSPGQSGNSPSNGPGSPGSHTTAGSPSPSLTTITYSDTECGCHKTTTVPIVSTVCEK